MLADAGYHVVAPDMRGYGESDKPVDVDDYDIIHVAGDLVGILDALGEETAILVGHDWGSMVVWYTALLHPDRSMGYGDERALWRTRKTGAP